MIYDGVTSNLRKTISRFKDVAYGGSFRADSKLIAAGCQDSSISLFDVNSRIVLRSLTGHTGPVHRVRFSSDFQYLVSGGDDGTVRYWDIPTQNCISIFTGHKDYVRSGVFHPMQPQLFVSGGYDNVVRIWDVRMPGTSKSKIAKAAASSSIGESIESSSSSSTSSSSSSSLPVSQACVRTLDHGYPIESLILSPSGSVLYTVGGEFLKLHDLAASSSSPVSSTSSSSSSSSDPDSHSSSSSSSASSSSPSSLLQCISAHTKTVTSVSFDGSGTRLLTSGLDQFIKIYELSTYKVTHTYKYNAPILCAALSPDNTLLVAGLADGQMVVRARETEQENGAVFAAPTGILKKIRHGTAAWFKRGQHAVPAEEDYRVESLKKQRLAAYDVYFKQFQYHRALDAALTTNQPVIICSVLDELIDRNALPSTLSNRTESELELLLRFLVHYVTHPYYSSLLVDVTNIVLDLYGKYGESSMKIDEWMMRLKEKIQQEVETQKGMWEIQGAIETLTSAADSVKGWREEALEEEAGEEEEEEGAKEHQEGQQTTQQQFTLEQTVQAQPTSGSKRSSHHSSNSNSSAPNGAASAEASASKSKKYKKKKTKHTNDE